MKGQWVMSEREYGPSVPQYKIGEIIVGSVFHDSCRSRFDPKKFKVCCVLPGIKANLGHYEKEEDGRRQLEKAVNHWFILLGKG